MQALRNNLLFLVVLAALATAQTSSPANMQPTDPKAVSSATNPAAAPVPIEDLYYTRVVTGASWSPDGKTIAFATNLTGRINLWKVDAAGGWPIQMSRSEERQGASTWSPDGKWIYFHSDFGGNEQYDTFAVPAAGGATVNLTNSPEFREQATLISPDGEISVLRRESGKESGDEARPAGSQRRKPL